MTPHSNMFFYVAVAQASPLEVRILGIGLILGAIAIARYKPILFHDWGTPPLGAVVLRSLGRKNITNQDYRRTELVIFLSLLGAFLVTLTLIPTPSSPTLTASHEQTSAAPDGSTPPLFQQLPPELALQLGLGVCSAIVILAISLRRGMRDGRVRSMVRYILGSVTLLAGMVLSVTVNHRSAYAGGFFLVGVCGLLVLITSVRPTMRLK